MKEAIIVIVGLVLTFWPVKVFFEYLMMRARGEASFDEKVKQVRDFRGQKGVYLLYTEKILWGLSFLCFGGFLSTYLINKVFLKFFIIFLILYIVCCYYNNKKGKGVD